MENNKHTPNNKKALKLAQYIMAKIADSNSQQEMEKPLLISAIADNGQHSHWILVDNETGDKLWSEDPEECKAIGYPVKETEEFKALKQQNEELVKMLTACEIILGISANCMKSDNPTTAGTVTNIKKEITELLTKYNQK